MIVTKKTWVKALEQFCFLTKRICESLKLEKEGYGALGPSLRYDCFEK